MNRFRSERGFSLVELMVTIVVALLLLVGISRVFITSKQSYRVQESASRLQENIRIASDYFNRYLRVADYWGGASGVDVTVLAGGSYTGKASCNQAWIINPGAGIFGYAGDAANPTGFPAGCLSRYVPNTDVLVVRGAQPDAYLDDAQLTAAAAAAGKVPFFVRSRIGQQALLFHSQSAATALTTLPSVGPGSGIVNYRYGTFAFYIQTNDFGRGPVPTLAMLQLESDAMESEPLVDGIETLAFSYGVDTNDDLQVDRYLEAADITEWRQVLSVRVSFIARGDELDSTTDTERYPVSPTRCYGPAGSDCPLTYSAADARFQRRLVVQEIQLRNRVRG
jgi:type IV pilus assembly protein PilW